MGVGYAAQYRKKYFSDPFVRRKCWILEHFIYFPRACLTFLFLDTTLLGLGTRSRRRIENVTSVGLSLSLSKKKKDGGAVVVEVVVDR
jgi:hypothetical protein